MQRRKVTLLYLILKLNLILPSERARVAADEAAEAARQEQEWQAKHGTSSGGIDYDQEEFDEVNADPDAEADIHDGQLDKPQEDEDEDADDEEQENIVTAKRSKHQSKAGKSDQICHRSRCAFNIFTVSIHRRQQY